MCMNHREIDCLIKNPLCFYFVFKRGHMGSLPEEMHPGALPLFAWIRKP